MTQVYFHCSNTKKVFVDYRGAVVNDLADARDQATLIVRSLTEVGNLEDWRDWVLHVSDDLGDDVRQLPLSGKGVAGRERRKPEGLERRLA
jgi:hypothetical protein